MLFNMDQIPILVIFIVVKAFYPGERLWRWGVPRWTPSTYTFPVPVRESHIF